MVGILKLAADYDCEEDIGQKALDLLQKGQTPSLGSLQRRYETIQKDQYTYPEVVVPKQNIAAYDQLLSSSQQEAYHAWYG